MANRTVHADVQYHSWKPEPLTRGTFSILSMSLITMTLCVWTAVHLNIPEHGKPIAQIWRKLGWLLTALLAPEMVLLAAYCQYTDAMELGRVMRKAFGQPEPPNLIGKLSRCIKRGKYRLKLSPKSQDHEAASKSKRHEWTDAHSLYAAMGGFAIDTRRLEQTYLPNNIERMTLTLKGLDFIAKHDPELLPDLSETEIQDKSKANSFTKLLTCGQTLWFCTQCLTRWGQGLFISLLEINTAVHSICALLLYVFLWWEKPLDVEEATLCQNQDVHPIGALMALRYYFPKAHMPHQDHDPLPTGVQLTKEQIEKYFGVHVDYDGDPYSYLRPGAANVPLRDHQIHCFRVAYAAITKYGIADSTYQQLSTFMPDHTLKNRIRNSSNIDSYGLGFFGLLSKGLVLAGCFYGGFHLLAWNRTFRGPTDELLWKVSSLTILISGFLLPLVMGIHERIKDRYTFVSNCFGMVLAVVFVFTAVFYILCRVFIIVECFLDVFHLPDSAFDVPKWSQYFPHIG